jgi:hypothetical protein
MAKELGDISKVKSPTKGQEGISGHPYIFAVLKKGVHHG